MSLRKFLAATLLMAIPVLTVYFVKQTSWGEMRAAPAARQKGETSARLVIVEFSDFQCPTCATVQPAIHQYMDTYKGKIRFIYKYYPLTRIHLNAMPAAIAAECAAQQKQFWPYHDALFQQQSAWSKLPDPTNFFATLAQGISLDMTQFNTCRADPARRWAVEMDTKEAVERQVKATPTFFIGEERVVGNDFMTNGALTIEKELRKME